MDVPDPDLLIRKNYSDYNLDAIREYLERGGDPNYQFEKGITVFHEAVCFLSDNIEVIHELINAGADINMPNHIGITPLIHAVLCRKRRVVEALIQSGASVNAKDFFGKNVLHHAVFKVVFYMAPVYIQYNPDIWIIKKLLEQESIEFNSVDFNGDTPLMVAIKYQQYEAAIFLLKNKVNPNICNKVSETPLHLAFSLTQHILEIWLLYSGASIYHMDETGRTPLDILIQNGIDGRSIERIKLILKIIAFQYVVESDLKKKIEHLPHLSQYFNECCNQVDRMRVDCISGKITMHDFLWKCFDEKDFKILLLQIHKPVVERLTTGIYSKYLREVLLKIPKSSLCSILQMAACSKKREAAEGTVKDLAYLLSLLDVVYMFWNHLSLFDIYNLLCVFLSDEFSVNAEFP